jgi:hypothetical protein
VFKTPTPRAPPSHRILIALWSCILQSPITSLVVTSGTSRLGGALAENESPTDFQPPHKAVAEWDKIREGIAARRRTKQAASLASSHKPERVSGFNGVVTMKKFMLVVAMVMSSSGARACPDLSLLLRLQQIR